MPSLLLAFVITILVKMPLVLLAFVITMLVKMPLLLLTFIMMLDQMPSVLLGLFK
jgi:hypothetical protein